MMKIAFLIPGTGSSYCGACLRDHALAQSLREAGHQVTILPMYMPLQLDGPALEESRAVPIFFAGISLMLRDIGPRMARFANWAQRILDAPGILRWVSRHSQLTASSATHGSLTLAMLMMEDGRFESESAALGEWLAADPPDVLCLSTSLQAGLIRRLRARFPAMEIVCSLQGEDGFLDGLPEPWRVACWHELARRVEDADWLMAPSQSYAQFMTERLGLAAGRIKVLHNGLPLDEYLLDGDGPWSPPVIGYLARLCRDKGLEVMVDAFIHLRRVLGHPDARLCLAGTVTVIDRDLILKLRQRLLHAGLAADVTWLPNLSRARKLEVLRGISVFSLPVIAREAFGLYAIEALAAGVPTVMPETGAFPELLEGAAELLPVHENGELDPSALAERWLALLNDPARREAMAEAGRRLVVEKFDVRVMREHFLLRIRQSLS